MLGGNQKTFSCKLFYLVLALSLTLEGSAQASWIWSPESGKFVNPEGAANETADQQYHYALGFYEAKNYGKAAEELKSLTKKYPGSLVAPEAQFKLGQIYEEQNEFYRAFKAYQKIVESYPQSSRMNEVIEKQFRIGNVFLSGKKPKLMGVPILPALPRAIEVLDQIVKNAPFSEYGDKSMFNLGVAYKRSGNLPKALETFQHLVDNYPDSPLVPDSKFQLGEVSFEMSKNLNRSQEGLDSAEDYFQSFLAEYPQANVREKAEQLKKAIDEKNAEKNFKIGQYYEDESYLESATIYYEDVAKNYSGTSWAAKAKEKLAIFRSPVKFIKEKEDDLQAELTRVTLRKREIEEKASSLPKDEETKKKELDKNLRDLSKTEKKIKSNARSFGRRKVSDIRKRREALKRKQGEFREKEKALENKKKIMKNNHSEDLQRAFANWGESLREEGLALQSEKSELDKIQTELGIGPVIKLPFPRKVRVEDLRQMHIDQLADLMEEKKLWDVKKEELYEFRKSVLGQLNGLQGEDIELLSQKKEFREVLEKHGGKLQEENLRLARDKAQLEALKSEFEAKREKLEKLTGRGPLSRLLGVPRQAVKRSWDLVTFSSKDPRDKLKEAIEKKKEIAREIAAKQEIAETIQKSFQEELQGKPASPISKPKDLLEKGAESLPEDVQLKKRIKLIEREIRWRYDEVQDRSETKRAKIEELDSLLKTVRGQDDRVVKAERVASAPAVGTYRFFHAFLFGLKQKEEVIRSEALAAQAKSTTEDHERIQKLREEIEFESLLIEARGLEIDALKKDLETIVKEASKRKGFSYRSVFIERPGNFLQDMVTSARKVLPRKDRKEILVERLDSETQALMRLQEQEELLSEKIKELKRELKSQKAGNAPREQEQVRSTKDMNQAPPEAVSLEKELATLKNEIGMKQRTYEESRAVIQKELKEFYRRHFSKRIQERFGLGDRELENKKKLFDRERKKTEEEILKIVKKEEKIVRKQHELLNDKKERIQKKIIDFKKKQDYHVEILENELEDLLDQTRQVESEKKNLLEEKKKLSDGFLKGEAESLER